MTIRINQNPVTMPEGEVDPREKANDIDYGYHCWFCGKKHALRDKGTIIFLSSYIPRRVSEDLKGVADVRMVGESDACITLYERHFFVDEMKHWSRATPHFCDAMCLTEWVLAIVQKAQEESGPAGYTAGD